LVALKLDSYTYDVTVWGKGKKGTNSETRLEEGYTLSKTSILLYHPCHLGSFGKCILISAGSSAKST